MKLQELLDAITDVEGKIHTLKNLQSGMGEKDATERCAGISYRGSWTVYFTQAEVQSLLQQRHDGLHVQLNRLLAAKDAAEKTAAGWMYEQERTQ